MFLVYLAVICSAMSVITGIAVVGNGDNFGYTRRDILRGRRDAWLYIWITFSTIFGLAHCGALLDYGFTYNWDYRNFDTGMWMAIHSGVGLLLTTAHLFLHSELKRSGSDKSYLWGNGNAI